MFVKVPTYSDQTYKIWFQAISIEPGCTVNCELAASCKVLAMSEEIVLATPSSIQSAPIVTNEQQSAKFAMIYGSVAFGALFEANHIGTNRTDFTKDTKDDAFYLTVDSTKKPLISDLCLM